MSASISSAAHRYGEPQHMPSIANLALLSAAILLSLGLGEVALRAFTPFPIHGGEANRVFDPDLGYRLSSRLAEIDSDGFRNSSGGGAWTVAAIGDSHTYGYHVTADQAWPKALGRLIDRDVYNFGMGSYGIFTYYALLRRAIDQRFDAVIVGLYYPNDFVPSSSHCSIDFSSPFWVQARWELALDPPKCETPYVEPDLLIWAKDNVATLSAMDYFLWDHIRTAIWHVLPASYRNEKEFCLSAQANMCIEKERVASHAKATDLGDPRIASMLDNFRLMMGDAASRAREAGVKLGILMIPSRERIVYEWRLRENVLQDKGEFEAKVRRQVVFEDVLKQQFRALEVPVESALDELVAAFDEAMAAGDVFFKPYGGHPFEPGYMAYTRAAAALASQMMDAGQPERALNRRADFPPPIGTK
jgi:hypothetical protein